MPKKTYTVSTRLQKNSPLVCYMEAYITEYNQIYRYAWQVYTSETYSFATDSKFRTHLCEKFGILGRTACSHRKKVELIEVNPKNTSKIGKQKYSKRMKLSVHQAASYVIARKGQGYLDRLVS